VTIVALLVATQALDVLGYTLAAGHGTELNPLVALVGYPGMAAVKLAVGALAGVFLLRFHGERAAPIIALIGCVGGLSEVLARGV
jgi:hypothetical protein